MGKGKTENCTSYHFFAPPAFLDRVWDTDYIGHPITALQIQHYLSDYILDQTHAWG